MIAVCLCDAQPITVEGLRGSLRDADDLRFAGAVSTPSEALGMLERERPHVCLLDKAFGFRTVLSIVAEVKKRGLGVAPIIWADEITEVESFQALQAGARGILKKTLPIEVILDCLRTVAKGSTWNESSTSGQRAGFIHRPLAPLFTPREEEILALVMRGMRNKQIAETLRITTGTVKVHMMHIFDKAGVKDRLELALYGERAHGFADSSLPIRQ